ncbi:NifU family protein [bacterium AH-315-L15]|nr:NifU family protein [bacterium AH-315-L15]
MDQKNEKFLEDVQIDFIQTLEETGFKIENSKVIESKSKKPESPPKLDTPEAIAIQKVLDVEINPAVASHGGHISLVDVKDQIAYIRLGGGCQGCGQADVTLKQGVVVAIKKGVPEIRDVLDVTDHANGDNPYYSPGK